MGAGAFFALSRSRAHSQKRSAKKTEAPSAKEKA
jgi:hypothetical protein